jgi:Tol biopolymer transport system component
LLYGGFGARSLATLLHRAAALLLIGADLADGAATSLPYQRAGMDAEIYVMSSDGSNQANVTNAEGEDSYPAWSSDGSKIAFTSFRGSFGNPDIFVMSPDGSGLLNITDDLAEDFDPAWSPDGSKIVFSRSTGGYFHVYTMDADGTDVQQLTDLDFNDAM